MEIITMAAETYSTMTTKHPDVMEAISALTNAVSHIVKRDKTITSMLLALPEHLEVCKERDDLKKQLSAIKAQDELIPSEPLKITIHEKSDATQTVTASDIRKQYDIQDKNVLKDVKTVTAQLGSLSISTACKEACAPGGFANRLNDFSQKLYEVIDSLGQDNEAYTDMQNVAEEFETMFKPWLSTSISKQSIIDLMPLPRTTVQLEEEKTGDNERDDDDEDDEDDDEEEEEEEEEESEGESDEEEENEDDSEVEEEETSVDNVDAVANNWDENEHNRVVQGDKDERERLQGVEEQETFFKEKYNSREGDDLSEEEEDDGTTVSDDEQSEDDDSEEEEEEEEEAADPETSSEELVVCEMEDEEGNALEYLTNDPEEMNGDIFELLDGDEVGKKIGRFVDGEPEFFD